MSHCCIVACDGVADPSIVARVHIESSGAEPGAACRRSTSCIITLVDWNAMWSVDTCRIRVVIDLPARSGGTLMLDGPFVDVLSVLDSHGVRGAVARVRGRDWQIHPSIRKRGSLELTCEGSMLARLPLDSGDALQPILGVPSSTDAMGLE